MPGSLPTEKRPLPDAVIFASRTAYIVYATTDGTGGGEKVASRLFPE
jgi:hypothetical protein